MHSLYSTQPVLQTTYSHPHTYINIVHVQVLVSLFVNKNIQICLSTWITQRLLHSYKYMLIVSSDRSQISQNKQKTYPKKSFFFVFLATEFNCDVDVLCMECFGVGEIQQHDTIEVKVFDRIDCKIFAYYAFVLCKNIQRKHTTTAAINCCFAFSTKILSGKLIITVYIFHWCVYGWINRRLIKSRYIYY